MLLVEMQELLMSPPKGFFMRVLVLKYDPATKKTTVLLRNIQFPFGITLNKDGSFFIFCEGSIRRLPLEKFDTALVSLTNHHDNGLRYQCGTPNMLIRYWLKGSKAGTTDIFAILPGFPDKRTNQEGHFWVALHCRRRSANYWLSTRPKLREFLLNLPIEAKHQFMLFV